MSGETEVDGMRSDLSHQATAWLVQLDDEPDNEALRVQFIDWLATSPAHLAAWEETDRVSGLMSAIGPLFQSEPKMSASPAQAVRLRRFPSTRTLASLAMAMCLAWFAVPYLALQLRSDEITGTGELRVVGLKDGSTVHLAPTTAIAFSSTADGRALTLLQGEAWFNVAHDKARPFRVIAGDSTVTVLGTAFSVRRKESGTDVSVQRGRVAVAKPDGTRRIVLAAGQSLSLSADKATRSAIRPDRVASWRDGVAIVNDQSIDEVIDRIRPWYGGYIIARGPGLKSRRVSGIYDLRHSDRALEALARAHKVTVSQVSPWLRIVTVG
ncbi:FecR family protein [Novosphingobium sp. M1R2S20]|uniref:FecR domain-containing protein n=1 Tax=Novosphingobium rhizovicinum TaxID=3228928 RepID=A0ABV3R9Q3_9SPHN